MAVYREVIETPGDQSFRLLHWRESLAEVLLCEGANTEVPMVGRGDHWHAHGPVELTFIRSGSGTRFIGDHIGSISPPELVLLGANLPHYWSGLRPSSGIAVQLSLSPSSTLTQLSEAKELATLWEQSCRGLLFPRSTALRAGEQLDAMLHAPPLKRLAILLDIFGELVNESGDATLLCDQVYALSPRGRHQEKVSHAIEILLADFAHELSVDDIADAVELPSVTLSRYFRRYTGRSLIEFLNEVRIDQARRMLLESEEPIGTIALAVGFGNLSHFNRQFRKKTGYAPRDYRKSRVTPTSAIANL
ncbi:helix-turn-helix domain-containing protein [Aeoliella sp. SH292]|uniref:helix-turn-helix domain-containing protein n=1 Tax=Aeoliella sp. SH292 TaxID=3454464 RepID=UPI003F9C4AD5